jgi:hypothetical protein
MRSTKWLGASCLAVGLSTGVVAAGGTPEPAGSSSPGAGASRVSPLESPSGDSCFEWKYPDKAECGELKAKTECKAKASIDASEDEKKKEACKPTKGDECFCD